MTRILYIIIVAILILVALYVLLQLVGAIADASHVDDLASVLRRHKAH